MQSDIVESTIKKIEATITTGTSDPNLATMLTELNKQTKELQEEHKKNEEAIAKATAIIESAQVAAEEIDQPAAPLETVPTTENLSSDQPDAQVEKEPDAQVETEPDAPVEPEPDAHVETNQDAPVEPEPAAPVETAPAATVETARSAVISDPDKKEEQEMDGGRYKSRRKGKKTNKKKRRKNRKTNKKKRRKNKKTYKK